MNTLHRPDAARGRTSDLRGPLSEVNYRFRIADAHCRRGEPVSEKGGRDAIHGRVEAGDEYVHLNRE